MRYDAPVAWNLVTRLSHWLIAIPVLLDFFIEGGEMSHKVLGYISLGTTFFRFIWGFFTKDEANFSSFTLHVKKTSEYAMSAFTKNKIHYPGHNPLASWVYIFMWILVLSLGITGFMMGLDRYWGEKWLEELHEAFSKGLILLVALHFIGLILDSWKFKRKTWLGMFTGKKS